jgi:hypothetical protein
MDTHIVNTDDEIGDDVMSTCWFYHSSDNGAAWWLGSASILLVA